MNNSIETNLRKLNKKLKILRYNNTNYSITEDFPTSNCTYQVTNLEMEQEYGTILFRDKDEVITSNYYVAIAFLIESIKEFKINSLKQIDVKFTFDGGTISIKEL